MGPTASGKTRLAELLCERLPCDVISVDSSAVYRGMDIGSAKPDAALQARLPHSLIDVRSIHDTYSAADFVAEALQEIRRIRANGRVPMLVGGSMLYFKALRDGLAELPAADPDIRQQIEDKAQRHGWQAVHDELKRADPESAARIHPNDPQRLQRALEVYQLTGNTLTSLQQRRTEGQRKLDGPLLQMALQPASRELLHQRIAQRFEQMLAQGLVNEVRGLIADLNVDVNALPALRAAGYRQAIEHLQGLLSADEMKERGIIATRQLAKRQLTWLRSWPELQLLEATAADYGADLQLETTQSRSIIGQARRLCETFLSNGAVNLRPKPA